MDYNNFITELRSNSSLAWAEKRRLLNQLMSGYSTKRIAISGERLYRARPIRHPPRLYGTVKDLWYPPAKSTKPGRANKDNDPVFYAAENWHTAFKETIGEGELAVGMEVERDKNARHLKCFSVGSDEALVRRDCIPQRLAHPAVDQFLRDEFTRVIPRECPDNYGLSSLISELFFECQDVDGLVYPSVPFGLEWLNVALRPRVVDELYKPTAISVALCWSGVWAIVGVGAIDDDGRIVYSCHNDAVLHLPGVTVEATEAIFRLFEEVGAI